MCGIAGVFNIGNHGLIELGALERMIYSARHRGPDGYGFFRNHQAGLAHARLSIIDLEGGWQPIPNEDKTLWIVFNGEIFNYLELRSELEQRGHRFGTKSDTEVILHLYEEKGELCLDDLNGQFAFAILNVREHSLFLARDRVGIVPLHYCFHEGRFLFASEVKSLFAFSLSIQRQIDPLVLSQIFTFWMPAGEDTVFSGVRQLLPGHWARLEADGTWQVREYWDFPFHGRFSDHQKSDSDYSEGLKNLLIDSVRLRLRSDVPVGAYLSGGIDSSAITTLVRNFTDNPLRTFSVTFADRVYDERKEQMAVSNYLRTDHHAVDCGYADIATAFPDVIWHGESPILRTAPTPLFLLAKLVHDNQYKVVLTGEGSDEVLGGYDIFKEAKIRAFIYRNRESACRPLLLKRLYPYLALSPTQSAEYGRKFFDTDAPIDDLFYAHRPRWKTARSCQSFFSREVISRIEKYDPVSVLFERFRDKLQGLGFFERAQYVEARLLLSNYLLSSQGDRMAMAHSVEGRFPFLDHRVLEYACALPLRMKMNVLDEKYVLKKAMEGLLPASVLERKKQPYMAPDILSFFGEREPDYLGQYLSEDLLAESGLFHVSAVKQLVSKCRRRMRQGFRENMAFVGILSTQILYDRFVRGERVRVPDFLPNVRMMA